MLRYYGSRSHVQWDSLNIVVKRGAASVSLDAQGGQLQVSRVFHLQCKQQTVPSASMLLMDRQVVVCCILLCCSLQRPQGCGVTRAETAERGEFLLKQFVRQVRGIVFFSFLIPMCGMFPVR